MSLKEAFRPTGKKVIWTLVVGIPSTAIGFLIALLSYADFFGATGFFSLSVILVPSYIVAEVLPHLPGIRTALPMLYSIPGAGLTMLFAVQFAYYYALVSLIIWISSKFKRQNASALSDYQ